MSVYIVRRETKKGTRWYVRAEITLKEPVEPGSPLMKAKHTTLHLGTFDTLRRAKMRVDAAKDDIAVGRVPQRFQEVEAPPPTKTVGQVGLEWIATRHDLKDVTRTPYERMIARWPARLAKLDVAVVTHTDIQAWVMELSGRLMRGTVSRELTVMKLVLDYGGRHVDNPARDRRVTLPRRERRVYRLPTRVQIAGLHAAMPTRVPLMLLLEWTGLRIHEAWNLRWRDIDYTRDRFLVPESKTPSGRRFIDHLEGAPDFPVKPDGADESMRVFPQAMSLTNVLRESHERNGTFLMSAHEFRHLHASRLLHDGILSPAQISARMGHADPSVTLKTYTHVVPPD